MKDSCCHLKDEPRRYFRLDLQVKSWNDIVKFTKPDKLICGSHSLWPTACQFLYEYVADHTMDCKLLNGKQSLAVISRRFMDWKDGNDEKYACYVAQMFVFMDEDVR